MTASAQQDKSAPMSPQSVDSRDDLIKKDKDFEGNKSDDYDGPSVGMSMMDGVIGLVKCAVGTGALALPCVMTSLGWGPATLSIIFCSLLTAASLHFLARLAHHSKSSSYMAIGRLAFGSAGEWLSIVALMLFLFGALIAYCAKSADFLLSGIRGLYKPDFLTGSYSELFFRIVCGVVIFSLAALRDMSSLNVTNKIGVACNITILLLLLVQMFTRESYSFDIYNFMAAEFKPLEVIRRFSIILFSFVNHFTIVAIMPSFDRPNSKRRFKLTLLSALGVLTYNLLLAVSGYVYFGNGSAKSGSGKPVSLAHLDTILDADTNPKLNFFFSVARLLIGCMVIMTLPLLSEPLRGSLESILGFNKTNAEGKVIDPITYCSLKNLGLTGSLIAVVCTISITCKENALKILGAFTAFSGSMLVLILPALYLIKLSRSLRYRISSTEYILAGLCITVGLVMFFLGTYADVQSVLQDLAAGTIASGSSSSDMLSA